MPRFESAVAHWETFEFLLASGADWKSQFESVFEKAPTHGKVADLLLDAHESDNFRFVIYRLRLAIRRDCERVVRQIIGNSTVAHSAEHAAEAVKCDSPNSLRALIASRAASINATVFTKTDFWRPLCFLAKNQRILAVMFALGADFDKKDCSRQAPIHYFLRYQRVEEALTVMASGANLKVYDGSERLPRDVSNRATLELLDALSGYYRFVVSKCVVERIATRQFDLLRLRGCEICVGLQALNLCALLLCEIMTFAFSPLESLVPFHRVWAIAKRSNISTATIEIERPFTCWTLQSVSTQRHRRDQPQRRSWRAFPLPWLSFVTWARVRLRPPPWRPPSPSPPMSFCAAVRAARPWSGTRTAR